MSSEFGNCENSQFTGGKFIQQELPSSSNDIGNSENANIDEDEEEHGEEVGNVIEIDSENLDIIIEETGVQFSDLQVEDLVVVTVRSDRGNICQYVAKILEIES